MTKRITGFMLALAMLLVMIPSTAVSAAESTIYLDRLEVTIDVPINGVALKTDNAYVKCYSDYKNEFYWQDDIPVTYAVAWYEHGTGTPLAENTKAVLGKTYDVCVVLTPKSGYAFRENMQNYTTTLNGADVTASGWSNGSITLDGTYTAVAAATGDPVAYYSDMNLSPYEGNPFEATVTVQNATNVRYQWYITYGDGFDTGWSEFGGAVALEDGDFYHGCQTPHFQISTTFDDAFHEIFDGDFAVVCKVTADNGEVILNNLRYTVIPRTVVTNPRFSGIELPVLRGQPDWTAQADEPDKYTVTEVRWYGPKNADGSYTIKLINGNTFDKEGVYKCRIYVSPKDTYRFNDTSVASIDGGAATITTLKGEEKDPIGPDSYYIEREYTVKPDPAFTVQPKSASVLEGYGAKISWALNFTPMKLVLRKAERDPKGQVTFTDSTLPIGTTSGTFLASDNTSYVIRAYYSSTDYIQSNNFRVAAVTPAFTQQPVGGYTSSGQSIAVNWETNFTPVKLVVSRHDATAQETQPITISSTVTSVTLEPTAADGSYYWVTAYYSDTQYVTSDRIYVTNKEDYTVEIAGVTVKSGEFFDDDALTVSKTAPDSSYAFYFNGVLYLVNFQDYSADIEFSIPDFEIRYTGECQIGSVMDCAQSTVTKIRYHVLVWGNNGTLTVRGDDYSFWVNGGVTFSQGDVTVDDATGYAFNDVDIITVKDGGKVYVPCSQGGVFSQDGTISVLDGSMEVFDQGTWQSTTFFNPTITDGYVYVSNDPSRLPLEDCEEWDGGSLRGYDSVWIVSERVQKTLLGDMNFDGNLNTMDALLLFGCVNGARAMTAEQETVADYTEDGNINMMDALLLFKTVSGQ